MEDAKLAVLRRGLRERARRASTRSPAAPSLAIVDPSVLPNGFNDYEFNVDDVKVEDDRFEPFDLDVPRHRHRHARRRSPSSASWPSRSTRTITAGVYVNEAAYRQTFGEPDYLRTYVKLNDGVNANAGRPRHRGCPGHRRRPGGVDPRAPRRVGGASSNAFMRMFQGFMALGLFVGIAALGVIAFRSVVERRQQIGMLRAIGYQTGTVALTFVLESGFIALMGILSGVVGGMIISRNLFTSGQFSGDGIEFAIPWIEVLILVDGRLRLLAADDLVAEPPGGAGTGRGRSAVRVDPTP